MLAAVSHAASALNTSAARQLGLQTTGHAARGLNGPPGIGTANVSMLPGAFTRDALIAKAGNGLLVQEMFGPSLNPTTGDYSVGVSGFAIEGGEIARPVSEITIAGNLKDVFASLIAADDQTKRRRRVGGLPLHRIRGRPRLRAARLGLR